MAVSDNVDVVGCSSGVVLVLAVEFPVDISVLRALFSTVGVNSGEGVVVDKGCWVILGKADSIRPVMTDTAFLFACHGFTKYKERI